MLLQPQTVEKDPELRQIAAGQHSEWLHPAQIYSTITAWIIAALLVAYFTMPHVHGRVFALMLIIECRRGSCWRCSGASRRSSDRGAIRRTWTFLPNMSFSMVLSIGLFVTGVILWFAFAKGRTGPEPAVVRRRRRVPGAVAVA